MPSEAGLFFLNQRLGNDFEDAIGQVLGPFDAFEPGLHEGLTLLVVAFPAVEARGHARGDAGVDGIQGDDGIGQEVVAFAVFAMEVPGVGLAEGADEGPHLVGVFDVKIRVFGKGVDALQGTGTVGGGLGREPLVQNQGVGFPGLVEKPQRPLRPLLHRGLKKR